MCVLYLRAVGWEIEGQLCQRSPHRVEQHTRQKRMKNCLVGVADRLHYCMKG